MALPKNYSIWLAVDYNGIEKAFWNKPKRCEKHREWLGEKWFFRMEESIDHAIEIIDDMLHNIDILINLLK